MTLADVRFDSTHPPRLNESASGHEVRDELQRLRIVCPQVTALVAIEDVRCVIRLWEVRPGDKIHHVINVHFAVDKVTHAERE